jgi:hypothetical protein
MSKRPYTVMQGYSSYGYCHGTFASEEKALARASIIANAVRRPVTVWHRGCTAGVSGGWGAFYHREHWVVEPDNPPYKSDEQLAANYYDCNEKWQAPKAGASQ